jgi:hypothetical protein
MCALSPNGQRTAVPQSSIATNVHQPLDVHLHTFAQITFDFALSFENATDATEFVFVKVLDSGIQIHASFIKDRRRA